MNHNDPSHTTSLAEIFLYYLILLIIAYGLAALIVVSQVRIGPVDDALQKANWPAEALMAETFGNENSVFNHVIRATDRPKSVYKLAFEVMTDLRFDDIRSLFGSELPGFTIYNTKIFVAGKGLNYTNLPQDSPPPPEITLEKPKQTKPEKAPSGPITDNNKLKKTVLLYHTHYWESYKPFNNGQATGLNPDHGVIHDGFVVGNVLASHGIGYINTGIQNWGYNVAYQGSRILVQNLLKQNPTLTYLIDIHRDSSGRSITTMDLNNTSYARISFIIGEDNPDYSANLYMAKQIKNVMDKQYPGLVRGIVGKTKFDGNGVYNQDLSKNALLIEIGGIDNTQAEVDRASKAFGEALATYIKQSNP
ncbi:stage II sporulation protein P [Sporolactobacillus pectinivorans]|uniref:stage II sporulation protein P n=1 Tax=Sporolactobacillus pectinivorans TaxID=1591408 RepID=UPI001875487E|nr:stage II sporulation protein P [Sporolactobacillus pectinivorans]